MVKITDKILPNYGVTYYVLWESESFLHLGITPNQSIATCYVGRGQCELIKI
jgi:hypothetical protein